MPFLVLANK